MTSYCQQAFQIQSAIIHTAYLHVLLYDQTLLSPCESAVIENSAFTICFPHILCTSILVDAPRFALFTKSAVHLQPLWYNPNESVYMYKCVYKHVHKHVYKLV